MKELIQRAKAWRNAQWGSTYPGMKKPKSYFLSLLVLKAYERAKKKVGNTHFRDLAERYMTKQNLCIIISHHAYIIIQNFIRAEIPSTEARPREVSHFKTVSGIDYPEYHTASTGRSTTLLGIQLVRLFYMIHLVPHVYWTLLTQPTTCLIPVLPPLKPMMSTMRGRGTGRS